MNQQPDRFFRDKLHGYEKAVSPGVWARVSGNLPAKKNNILWIRIAAGVALLITASILIIRFPGTNGVNVATITGNPATSVDEPAAPRQKTPDPGKGLPETPQKDPNTTVLNRTNKRDLPVQKKHEPSTPTLAASPDNIITAVPAPAEKSNDARLSVSAPDPQEEIISRADVTNSETNKNITIVLTAKEVNGKYLKKKNVETQATSEVKGSSGLRKLLDKASDLKYNQDPFGDLRQKKNEILALNFKTSKRNENQ